MAKDTFYFSHDYNARNDEKIRKLLFKHGYQGYGIYWALIENLYNNANEMQTHYDSIAYELRTDSDLVKSIINDFDLFVIDNDIFYSISIQRRLNERNDKSIKASMSAKKRWENANAMRTHSDGNAIKESKGKESKENEIIINGKKFLNTDFQELPEIKIGSAIELLSITKKVKATKEQIAGLWEVFKVQNLTGENYYHSEEKVYSHFINWVKTQNFKDADSKKPLNQQRFDAYVEYANRHS